MTSFFNGEILKMLQGQCKHQMKKILNRGFTLIEVLLVIAIIAIIAAAVLSAINPIEQVNKGRDTGMKNDSAEFLNAAERYFVTFECYPWARDASGVCGTAEPAGDKISSMDDGATAGTVAYALKELENKQEIKPQYKTRKSLDNVYVTQDTNDQVHVCYLPTSATFQEQAKEAGLQRDGETTGCTPDAQTAAGCHICLPE